jgi:hypothetical protein
VKNYSRLLQKYAQVMLPPAPGHDVEMPSFPHSKAPDAEAIEQEQLNRIEEIEKAKEEGAEADRLKQEHLDEMLRAINEGNFFNFEDEKRASRSVDKILKLCTNYYHLCSK